MNLDWIGTMSDQELREFRATLERDLASARARGRSGKYSVQFCTTRIAAIDAVLAGRGVVNSEQEA